MNNAVLCFSEKHGSLPSSAFNDMHQYSSCLKAASGVMLSLSESIELDCGGEQVLNDNAVLLQRRNSLVGSSSCAISRISSVTGIPYRTADRDISRLRKKGYIRRDGSDNQCTWVVLKELNEDE